MGAPLAAALAVVLLAAGAVGVRDESPAPPTSEPALSRASVGVSPQSQLDAEDYRQVRRAKVGIMRAPLNWQAVQQVPGDCKPEPVVNPCNWGATDVVVGNAAQAGARILPILSNVPHYISKHPNKAPLKGRARRGWADFVDAVVRRYGPGGAFWENEYAAFYEGEPQPIVEWQVWNEPNGKVYFRPKPNPRKYAQLVKRTSRAIRRADPQAEVVLGGMFGSAKINLKPFLRGFYEVRRITDHFDALALHPYSRNLRDLKIQARWARRVARDHDDRDVGLWITELGWGSGKGGHPLEQGRKEQARKLERSFRLLARKRDKWNVEGVIWFTWQDRRDRKVCKFCRHAGLFNAKGNPKPAWRAFQRLTGAG